MTQLLKTLALSTLLLVPATARAQVSFGINIGQPPPPRVQVVRPQPHPDNVWVDGYWYPVGSKYTWHAGSWTAAPYPGAYWNEPYHNGTQYIAGYWDGDQGRYDHNNKTGRNTKYDDHGNGRGNDRR